MTSKQRASAKQAFDKGILSAIHARNLQVGLAEENQEGCFIETIGSRPLARPKRVVSTPAPLTRVQHGVILEAPKAAGGQAASGLVLAIEASTHGTSVGSAGGGLLVMVGKEAQEASSCKTILQRDIAGLKHRQRP